MEFDELCSLSADELERRKIAHEIVSQRMQWWKKPAWLAAMIPAVIAAASLGVTAYTDLSDAKIRVKEYEQRISNLSEDAKITERELRLRTIEAKEAEQKEKEAAKQLIAVQEGIQVTKKERDVFKKERDALQQDQDKFYKAGVKFAEERERITTLYEQVIDELESIREERNALAFERDQLAKDLEMIAQRDAEDVEAEKAAQAAREEARKAEERRLAAEITLQQESSRSTSRPASRPYLSFCQGRPGCIEP